MTNEVKELIDAIQWNLRLDADYVPGEESGYDMDEDMINVEGTDLSELERDDVDAVFAENLDFRVVRSQWSRMGNEYLGEYWIAEVE